MKDTLPARVRIGVYELDLKSGELRNGDHRAVLQEQPLQIVRMLIKREGELVAREEIKKKLWPNDTIVEFDHSINSAIKNLRRALGDPADEPRYIETLARRGYRLMVPVEWVEQLSVAGGQLSEPTLAAAVRMQPEPSALTGRTVSHYRVLEIIGGGGMGVVYRAEDLKLGRAVALKFLPEELGSDPQALERFSREARAASSLDHPNICPIHEFGEHEGRPFMVMQLLEGQTLRDRLTGEERALPLAELLDIGLQVCDGLRAAHEKGIIHRDIKPANIFLTSKGVCKILDFGIAKLLVEAEAHPSETGLGGAPAEPSDLSSRAEPPSFGGEVEGSAGVGALENADPSTPCPPGRNNAAGKPGGHSAQDDRARVAEHTLTRTGLAMGTAGYMSPEQVRGEILDARTDLFSFGLVLYEMATGQRAFSGETDAVVHDAILHDLAVPSRELNPSLPANLVTTVDKCLKKQREQRYQSVAEVRIALQEVRSVAAPSPASRRLKRISVASLAVLLVAACAVGVWWWRRPLAQFAFKNYWMTVLTSVGNVAFADISPDGRYLAYADDEVGKQSIWLKQLATSTTVRILGPVPFTLGRGLRFTADGNYLYYSQLEPDGSRFTIYRIAVLGGSPERIPIDLWNVDSTVWYGAVDFSPDGKKIVFVRYTDKERSLMTANADGSGQRRLLTLQAPQQMRRLAWSPDGQTIAFGIEENGGGVVNCIAVISSNGGKERRILRNLGGVLGIAWLPDQSGLVFTGTPLGSENSAVWIASYPEVRLRRVTNDVADYHGVSLVHGAVRLVTVQRQVDSSLWVAPTGSPSEANQLREGAGRTDGLTGGVAWLPDGRLVYGTSDVTSELWVVDRDGSNRRQLTHTNNTASDPSATAAGDMIVFERPDHMSNISENIWATDSNGSNLRQITSGSSGKWTPEVSPDGKWITYLSAEGPLKIVLAGGETTKLDPNGGHSPVISPDGRWIAFEIWDVKEEKGKIEIVASDGKGPPWFLPFISKPQVPDSTMRVDIPIRWTAAGDALTYVRTQNGVSNIWSQPIDGSPARQLTNFTSMIIWSHAWSRDGKYLVMARGNFSRDAVMLTDLR